MGKYNWKRVNWARMRWDARKRRVFRFERSRRKSTLCKHRHGKVHTLRTVPCWKIVFSIGFRKLFQVFQTNLSQFMQKLCLKTWKIDKNAEKLSKIRHKSTKFKKNHFFRVFSKIFEFGDKILSYLFLKFSISHITFIVLISVVLQKKLFEKYPKIMKKKSEWDYIKKYPKSQKKNQ